MTSTEAIKSIAKTKNEYGAAAVAELADGTYLAVFRAWCGRGTIHGEALRPLSVRCATKGRAQWLAEENDTFEIEQACSQVGYLTYTDKGSWVFPENRDDEDLGRITVAIAPLLEAVKA